MASACIDAGGPASAVQPLSLSLVEGSAFWLPVGARSATPISGEVQLGRDDQVWSSPDAGVTFRLPDGSLIHMKPNTGIRLRQPYAASTRPVIQLLSGEISVAAHSSDYLIESYREVPLSFRIVMVNMILDPKSSSSEFRLAFVGDTAEASVSQGGVE
ncbi:MAG TPA: FecR domain-containing protein, partial [Anaerolineae bacterium]|nr:FecR domain-containing protein [Anaerolineae bacterium]